MPTIQSLHSSQGYTPQPQSAITQQGLGASNTAFDALRERAANPTAAKNNSAGFGDLTAQLGREQAQTDASQTQQNRGVQISTILFERTPSLFESPSSIRKLP